MVTWLSSPTGSGSDHGETSASGEHEHKIKINGNIIGNAISGSDGNARKTNETRPKNIALLYCIKAK